jgi:cobalt-zinc-cadmium efflux system outer membrane protein
MTRTDCERLRGPSISCLSVFIGTLLVASPVRADPPAAEAAPPALTLDAAVAWALQNHPELAAVRQQHGIAAAAVVIARTYPFNPVWTNKLFAVNGPVSSGITNRVAMEQRVELELELCHQRRHRQDAAGAALTRTEWEIAGAEVTLGVRVLRAFNGLLYARGRMELGEENVRLAQQVFTQVRTLVERGGGRPEDLIVARSEVVSAEAALGSLRSALQRAEQDLRLALGAPDAPCTVAGTLELPRPADNAEALLATALARRPDLLARQAAVHEADARLRLAVADRFGNPKLGPDYEYNETRDNFIGAELVVPLPVLNKHKGEILQRRAEHQRAVLDLQSTEVAVRQAVAGALNRLSQAYAWADAYRKEVLPTQEGLVKEMEALFTQGRVDLLKVIDLRRKVLQARSGYLDALLEVRQADADLAAAVGDPTLAIPPAAAP